MYHNIIELTLRVTEEYCKMDVLRVFGRNFIFYNNDKLVQKL
jgi:hypothetical protein